MKVEEQNLQVLDHAICRSPLFPIESKLADAWPILKRLIKDSAPEFYAVIANLDAADLQNQSEKFVLLFGSTLTAAATELLHLVNSQQFQPYLYKSISTLSYFNRAWIFYRCQTGKQYKISAMITVLLKRPTIGQIRFVTAMTRSFTTCFEAKNSLN